eukprot:SAG31_NODE_23734_length_497_cov_1.155779_1_plen_27_part_10
MQAARDRRSLVRSKIILYLGTIKYLNL